MMCETCQGTGLIQYQTDQFLNDRALMFLPVMKNNGETIWVECPNCKGLGIDHCCGGHRAEPDGALNAS